MCAFPFHRGVNTSRINRASLVSLLFILASCSSPHLDRHGPPMPPADKFALFEDHKETWQPWKPELGLPTSLRDIGLYGAIELYEHASFGDGGSIGWIIRDLNGHYFAFWKEPRLVVTEGPDDTGERRWDQRRFWVGTSHHSFHPGGVMVPMGSECEKFLEELVAMADKALQSEGSWLGRLPIRLMPVAPR